jgi:hypothetical protein
VREQTHAHGGTKMEKTELEKIYWSISHKKRQVTNLNLEIKQLEQDLKKLLLEKEMLYELSINYNNLKKIMEAQK